MLNEEFQATGNMYGEPGRLAKALARGGGKKQAQQRTPTPSKKKQAQDAKKRKRCAESKPGVYIGAKVVHEWQSPTSGKKTDHEGYAAWPKGMGTKPAVLVPGMCCRTMGCIGSSHLLTMRPTLWIGKTWRRFQGTPTECRQE
jgi:hypothetical protein